MGCIYEFPNKRLRAKAIRRYMEMAGKARAVCFSCGNASKALRECGVDVVDISPTGDLEALRWFAPSEIERCFPGMFDATSGHLPIECMQMVADEFRAYIGDDMPPHIDLPTGSGETLVALKMAYPATSITAVYGDGPATAYDERAPLNALVRALADGVVVRGRP